ncbi:histidine phosphatase family protein [Amycolatopsis aidingensis]|uniref:histidine phosphatase family protein n=1 Tax=Amycolatopsis aidingensis TaxID=2842453 RepID=UPI001C0BD5EC|nr:histidine phosphatase family protein [Amycolatopsis aidingensis]
MSTHLLLVRHGETEWHAENRYAGTSEVALTATGMAQAETLACFLAALPAARRPDALYCSPQQRALHTARPAATALGLRPLVVEDLREVHFGAVEGRTLEEVDPELVARFRADPVRDAFPGSEPPEQAAKRGAAALRAIAEAESGAGPVLVVAHNTLLRLTLCELVGIPLRNYRRVFPRMDNCALTELRVDGENTAIRRFNQPTGGRE